jgi:hypothetical protein
VRVRALIRTGARTRTRTKTRTRTTDEDADEDEDGLNRGLGLRSERPPQMSKLILLSIIIAMITIPRAARDKNPRQGLRKVVIGIIVAEVF